MAEKTIDYLDKMKAYPQIDVDQGLWFHNGYQVNSWFYIGRADCEGENIVFLYHAINYQFPGQDGMLVSSLTFTNQTTGEHHMISNVYQRGQVEMSEDKFCVKCPDAEIYGDISAMYVKAKADFGWVDVKVEPMGSPLYNSRTGRYSMLDLDIHQYALPKMDTTGKININGKDYDFNGNTWLDRQWQIDITLIDPENPPEMDLTAIPTWGWISIALENGETLSVWFPKDKGKWYSWATIMHDDGEHVLVGVDGLFATADNWYHDEDSPFTYATKYTVRIPEYDAELVVTSDPIDQEIRNFLIPTFNYFEGACNVSGTWNGQTVEGIGFLELIGVWIREML